MVSAQTGRKKGGPEEVKLVQVLWKGCVMYWAHKGNQASENEEVAQSWSAVTS